MGFAMIEFSPPTQRALFLELCYFLTKRIVSGAWRPGFILPNERELAREYGVGPGTVRKVLRRLQADRLVRPSSRGMFVVELANTQAAIRLNDIRSRAGKRIDNASVLLGLTTRIAERVEAAQAALIREGDGVARAPAPQAARRAVHV